MGTPSRGPRRRPRPDPVPALPVRTALVLSVIVGTSACAAPARADVPAVDVSVVDVPVVGAQVAS
ncbi:MULTISPECIES: hypothetical protein [unclassified Geodermatophilus]